MYGGFDVFKVYLAVKLHFTSNYDYFEYDGKVNCKLETFTKKEMIDIFFINLHKIRKDEILDFFVANFCENDKKWVGNLLQNDGRETYLNYRKIKDNFKYHFRNEFTNIVNDFSTKRFLLMMVSYAVMDNIHDFYVYLFKGERLSRPSLCLTKCYRLSKIEYTN